MRVGLPAIRRTLEPRPGVKTWGQWEGVDRDRQSVELDITRPSRTTVVFWLVGEVKMVDRASGPQSARHGCLDKLSRLAMSGQGWAKDVQSAVFLRLSRGLRARNDRAAAG